MINNKPVPVIDEDSRVFWENCRENKLVLPKCRDCGDFFFYPRIVCPHCMSEQIDWKEVSGKGKVYSFTIVRRPAGPAFKDDVPYVVAIIQLDAGPRMMSNIINTDLEDIKCDMPVHVTYTKLNDEITLPMFQMDQTYLESI